MKRGFPVFWLVLGACNSGPPPSEPFHPPLTVAEQIVGGEVATGDPEVFALFVHPGGFFCSATLVGSRTLLTAAHCVDPNLGTIWATNSTDVERPVRVYRVEERRAHPRWNDSAIDGFDVALLLIDAAPEGVAPKPYNTTSLDGFEGRPIRAVGYGADEANQHGIKRQVEVIFRGIDEDRFALGDQTQKGVCYGDSGGPTFHRFEDGIERLVGVHSYTISDSCLDGVDMRVDAHADFIEQWFLEKEERCIEDGRCRPGCTPPDIDCLCQLDGICGGQCPEPMSDPDCPRDCAQNGVCAADPCPEPDIDCVPDGQPCHSELQCAHRLCMGNAQRADFFCTRGCSSDADCPTTLTCVRGVCHFGEDADAATHCDGGGTCEEPSGPGPSCSSAGLARTPLRGWSVLIGLWALGRTLSRRRSSIGARGRSVAMAIIPDSPPWRSSTRSST